MTDYIKREDAMKSLRVMMDGTGYQDMAIGCINRLLVPSADVAPVRHGKWEEKDIIEDRKGMGIISDWQSARCSVCGKYHTTPYAYYFTNYEYCPSCGAKMDVERKDNE